MNKKRIFSYDILVLVIWMMEIFHFKKYALIYSINKNSGNKTVFIELCLCKRIQFLYSQLYSVLFIL